MIENNETLHKSGLTQMTHNRAVNKYTWKRQLLRLPWLLLIIFGLMLPSFVRDNPDEVERVYSRTVYPVISRCIAAFTSIIPFSLAELLIIAVPLILVIILLIRLFKLIFGKLTARNHNRIKFFSYIISLGMFAGIMLNLFYCLWGFNHFRLPVSTLLGLPNEPHSVEQLSIVYERLASQAAELRSLVNEDANGVFTMESPQKAFEIVQDAYRGLGRENDLFANKVYKAKEVGMSEYMSKAGIAGIYIPYTAEMNVNTDQPYLLIPSGAAHETAHYMGFAREDEANFLAYYVSLFSDSIELKYSATMLAVISCGNQLYAMDRERFLEIQGRTYTDAMKRDIKSYSDYFEQYEDEAAKKLNDELNDAYLTYNGQEAGIASYDRMTELILSYFDSIGTFSQTP